MTSMIDVSELDWRVDEETETYENLTEVDVEDENPLARFQTPVPGWMLQENPCKSMAREIGIQETLEFFYGTHTWQQAKRVCASCPNKSTCRDYADKYGEEGVWGETSYPERKRSTNNKENK